MFRRPGKDNTSFQVPVMPALVNDELHSTILNKKDLVIFQIVFQIAARLFPSLPKPFFVNLPQTVGSSGASNKETRSHEKPRRPNWRRLTAHFAGEDIYGGSDRLLSQVVSRKGIVVNKNTMVHIDLKNFEDELIVDFGSVWRNSGGWKISIPAARAALNVFGTAPCEELFKNLELFCSFSEISPAPASAPAK
ncbi:hypothetical protein KSP40_PGU000163 [Platanthera guangdongensis]|uniref:Ribosomal protein S1 n=1 Tax=Platanthera guangdongensis TaxID=2320717 RepID=A0ABR2LMM4_9ASPA